MARVTEQSPEVKAEYVAHFKEFEERLNGKRNTPLHKIRQEAISHFSELGFPTTRNEEWKYTNVKPILKQQFDLSTAPTEVDENTLGTFVFPEIKENIIVFVNGHYSPDLSRITSKGTDLIIRSLAEAMSEYGDLIEQHLAHYADYKSEVFTALNTAFTQDGAFIYVPDNVVLDEPVHLIHVADSRQAGFHSHPRNLFVLGKNSQAYYIESYHHLADTPYFNNLVVEIILSENAHFEHVKIQDESKSAFHIANVNVHQGRHSNYTSINIDVGGSLVRNNLNVVLDAENSESHLYGFYLATGKQLIDNHTFIDHAKPHCESNELYKGILADKSSGVFNGKVLVRQDAQKTNAFQQNQSLLISDEATINAKPQLEIFADDVKCSHGATIGQLDEEALFYLRSRGISRKNANAMLRYAFAYDVFERVKNEIVRDHIDHLVMENFKAHIED